MTGAARLIAAGIGAALRTPLWLRDGRYRRLVDGVEQRRPSPVGPDLALRAAWATLRVLGRMPLLPWRNTCLYRSVAECLVLSRIGIACRLRIGVRRSAAPSGSVVAHAWVEWSGQQTPDPTNVILNPSG